MFWLVLTIAAGLLAYLLLREMRGYESDSAAAALEEVQRLTEVTEDLERRVQNLEAINTQVDDQLIQLSDDPDRSPTRGRVNS